MKHCYSIWAALAALLLTACQRENVPQEGREAVRFAPYVYSSAATKAAGDTYEPLPDTYALSVAMYQEGVAEPETASPLYWPGTTQACGFKAWAGNEELEADQSTDAKLLLQDRLEGFAYVRGVAGYDEDALNYRTAKQWYADNKSLGLPPEGEDASYYKQIPLYLKHRRALITIKLKAGEGVKQEDLTRLENIETRIHNYGGNGHLVITPLEGLGELEDHTGTSEFTAVVDPYDYSDLTALDTICVIKLSTQRFTFFSANDFQKDDPAHMAGYKLEPGKHLVITATLGRDGRKTLITALVEDWTETVTTSVVDDYGQAGDVIQINDRRELREFLESPQNKPGNVAIIVPSLIDLEKEDDADAAWTPLPLNCTMNMAGSSFRTQHPVFSTIGSSGNLVNGSVAVGDAAVTSAVAERNKGTLNHITVLRQTVSGALSTGVATRAGLVVNNCGVIVDCHSELPVKGTDASATYVGGIAALSQYDEDMQSMPVIENCTVNARVDGASGNLGGGIVGAAVGRVSGNRFEYGITVLQNSTRFKNIVQAKADNSHELRAEGNAWPTVAGNAIGEVTNANGAAKCYDATIDSQDELGYLLSVAAYNERGKEYRLSDGFSVSKATWTYGRKTDIANGTGFSVNFKLDGNEKTITTDAMLFSNIRSEIHDLVIRLGGDITPAIVGGQEQDAVAGFAYAVCGEGAKIRNIQVKAGSYSISGPNAGGVVVWAYDGGIVENCQCKALVEARVAEVGADAKLYAGGIVACAAKATITRCVFHNTSGTLFRTPDDTSAQIFYGGILGGTVPNGSGDFNSQKPEVLITDCISWFDTLPAEGAQPNYQKGAVVGYALYADEHDVPVNGLKKGCQGNWWGQGHAIGQHVSGMSEEELMGRRNAITPTHDALYD